MGTLHASAGINKFIMDQDINKKLKALEDELKRALRIMNSMQKQIDVLRRRNTILENSFSSLQSRR